MKTLILVIAALVAWPVAAQDGLYPPGFPFFCRDNPTECAVRPSAQPLADEWLPTLRRINSAVNASITYRPDPGAVSMPDMRRLYARVGRGAVPPGDKWTIAPEFGDCDDYAVTKYMRLVAAGIPRAALRFAYVLPYNGEPHLFLVAETERGPMVLDNIIEDVIELDRYPLTHLSLQDAEVPKHWHQIY